MNPTASVVNPNKIGLAFALILGGWHAVWSLLVLSGLAQRVYDFILWAHMIHLELTIGPFDPEAALTLVILTSAVGYVLGYVGAWIWKQVHR